MSKPKDEKPMTVREYAKWVRRPMRNKLEAIEYLLDIIAQDLRENGEDSKLFQYALDRGSRHEAFGEFVYGGDPREVEEEQGSALAESFLEDAAGVIEAATSLPLLTARLRALS